MNKRVAVAVGWQNAERKTFLLTTYKKPMFLFSFPFPFPARTKLYSLYDQYDLYDHVGPQQVDTAILDV